MKDKEMKRNRAAEDEKYYTSLANRAQEDKQRRERQTTKDEYLEIIESSPDFDNFPILAYCFQTPWDDFSTDTLYHHLATSCLRDFSSQPPPIRGYALNPHAKLA